jgi:hypothetical protein
VLHESGIPLPAFAGDAAVVAFNRRVLELPDAHEARAALSDERYLLKYHAAKKRPPYCAPWVSTVADSAYALRVSERPLVNLKIGSGKQLMGAALGASREDMYGLHGRPSSRRAHVFPAPVFEVSRQPGLPFYVRHDERKAASLRARLRLDVALLAHSLHKRCLSDEGPFCQYCKVTNKTKAVETVEHAMVHCTRYQNARADLTLQLRGLGLPTSLAVILGEFEPGVRTAIKLSALACTARFITAVYEIRLF